MEDVMKTFLALRVGLARVASRIVPPDEVEDIVQETYVRLCQLSGKEEVRHPKSYLYRVVRNLALDHVKRADHRLNQSMESEDLEPDTLDVWQDSDSTMSAAASEEEFGVFCDAVRALPVQCRRVFILKKVYNYSQKEIASELGISQSTVEKHVVLGIRRSMEYMQMKAESGQDRPTSDQVLKVVPLNRGDS